MASVVDFFAQVEDPRADNVSHRLGDLLVMMLAASLCGASSATEFALFAATRKAVLRRLIDYDKPPSHDTFSRLLRRIDPQALNDALARLAQGFAQALGQAGHRPGPGVLALDGKTLRRAYETGLKASPPLTVAAFAAHTRLCLTMAPAAADNEVETALKVVAMLDLAGQIVTADALHCHHRMAEAIIGRGGDYVLALKGNRRHWAGKARALFDSKAKRRRAQASERRHGRAEWRQAEVIGVVKPSMRGHRAFIRITASRDDGKPMARLFMASQLLTAKQALAITRAHWQIENSLHWMLDVHLGEDMVRARKDHAPANLALLKRLARNILQTTDSAKVPISHRINKCAWDNQYLAHALTHMR
jgi:predicted transposase YbfD/YdcC